jgi:DUF971 family protein
MNNSVTAPVPTSITLHQSSGILALQYEDGQRFELPCEYLRVFTPSAEARGHGPGQEVLQFGKRGIRIDRIEPVGNYALRLVFSDGHDTGLYSWDILHGLGEHQTELWQAYLDKLEAAGASRDPLPGDEPAGGKACQSGGGCSSGGCGK